MRLREFKAILEKKGVDFAVFLSLDYDRLNPNLFYFTGFEGIGALVVPAKKKPFLVAPALDYERAKECRVKVYGLEKKKRLFETIADLVNKNKLKSRKIGIDKGSLTLRGYKALKKYFRKSKTIDVAGFCFELRERKTKEEVRKIKKACSMSDKILKKCFAQFKKFKTESDVAAFLEYETRKLGCEISFKPIVASGKGSSMPHYTPKNVKLKPGFCVIDFGVRYKGYCSDTTRTIFLGKPSKKEVEIYILLLNVQEETIKGLRKGKKCSHVVGFVKKGLGRYEENFIHGLGHGVGIDVHELPNFKEDSKDKLNKGVVFTIEPGIYFESKFGIRIEDTVYLPEKAKVLTKIAKKMVIIK
jgi:Xaa-Pro aminopeptidase